MRLLGGVKERVIRGKGSNRRKEVEEERMSSAEIKRAIGKLKDGKAAEMDGIPNEMWRCGRGWR